MNVALVARDAGIRTYEATDPKTGRGYTARHNVVTGTWAITGAKGAQLSAWSSTWVRVVDACERWAAEHLEDNRQQEDA